MQHEATTHNLSTMWQWVWELKIGLPHWPILQKPSTPWLFYLYMPSVDHSVWKGTWMHTQFLNITVFLSVFFIFSLCRIGQWEYFEVRTNDKFIGLTSTQKLGHISLKSNSRTINKLKNGKFELNVANHL